MRLEFIQRTLTRLTGLYIQLFYSSLADISVVWDQHTKHGFQAFTLHKLKHTKYDITLCNSVTQKSFEGQHHIAGCLHYVPLKEKTPRVIIQPLIFNNFVVRVPY